LLIYYNYGRHSNTSADCRPNPKKKTTLEDMGDLFVLDFSPSLASLCLESLRRNGLSKKMEAFLPEFLK
jgi:hypothetical protein